MSKRHLKRISAILDELGLESDMPENPTIRDGRLISGREFEDFKAQDNYKQCHGKKCYTSVNVARSVQRNRERRGAVKLYIYQCPDCKMWHLTSADRRKKRKS